MDFKLKGKVALISASSRGIGKAVAKELAMEGCKVIICARTKDSLNATKREIEEETNSEVVAVTANITKYADIKKVVDEGLAAFGRIDILVNNSGGPSPGFFLELDDNIWYNAIDLLLMSMVRFTRLVLPGMQERKWGRIINLTSFAVKQPVDNLILSNSIRLAIIGFAKTLSNQVGKDNITVNNITQGLTLTERVKQLAQNIAANKNIEIEKVFENWKQEIPVRRLAEPEEIAAVVAFLASKRASFINGATIQVDGGQIKFVM